MTENIKSRQTLRNTIIFSFVSMIIAMIIGTTITLMTLSHITYTGKKANQEHQPAAYNALKLTKHMNKATAHVNDYLLTKDKEFKTKFYSEKEHILSLYSDSQQYFKHHQTDDIKTLETLFTNYFMLIDTLFSKRESDIENYPGLSLAAELTDPHTLAYLGIVNELINEEYDDLNSEEKYQLIKLFNDLRYSWIQMNNAFRIFISTRADNDIKNFYSYSDVNGKIHKKIKEMDIEIGFGALDELEQHRASRLENIPKVVSVFQSVGWRQDVHLLKTEVYPLLNKISSALETHSANAVKSASTDSKELTKLIQRTSILVGAILIVGLLIAISVSTIIQRNVKPLFNLANSVKNSSLKKPLVIDKQLLSLENEIGALARAFNQMSQNIITDIREREKAETKFEVLLSSSPNATVIVDRAGRINLFNRMAEILFGYSESEVLGKPIETLIPERYRKNHETLMAEFLDAPEFRSIDVNKKLFGQRSDGSEFPVEINLAPIDMKDGLLVSASIRDLTLQQETEEQLIHQANYDSLTNLPNRVLVMDRLEQAIVSSKRKNKVVVVMFIDLDQFKHVNDTLGHSIGDKLLCIVAQRLLECVRAYDTVARLGGDEFLVILPDLSNITSSELIADKIIHALALPYTIDNRDFYITASIGITGYPNDGDTSEILFRKADAAMYQAKNAGRSTYRFFTDEMNRQLIKRLDLESRLRHALRNEELYIHYQPQIDLNSNRLIGAEALLRWSNPVLGNVDTEEFVTIAEETGMIDSIGEWVLEQACHSACRWQNQYSSEIRVTVNISAIQLRAGDLVQKIKAALDQSHLSPHLLELELTERILIEDNPNTNRILNDLKRLGVRLSLDDFGKGYSSLSYLKQFPFDVLKIDRSFIAGLTVDEDSLSLCKAIVAMANSLHLDVIGEGVETIEQYQALCEMGANSGQGHFFNNPMSEKQFHDLLANPILTRVK